MLPDRLAEVSHDGTWVDFLIPYRRGNHVPTQGTAPGGWTWQSITSSVIPRSVAVNFARQMKFSDTYSAKRGPCFGGFLMFGRRMNLLIPNGGGDSWLLAARGGVFLLHIHTYTIRFVDACQVHF